ncbi:MAG: acyltransferase [Eubacteriales bacterium]|nr:acyltransferase [Eubacteriales bacterium]
MQQNNSFNTKISLYSFILTVLVIWIHAVDPGFQAGMDNLSGMDTAVREILGSRLGQLAVPGFFCMSGYLFFRSIPANAEGERAENSGLRDFFISKWKSRIRSILIPYVIWNTLYYLIYILFGKTALDTENFLAAIVYYKFNPVFWYLHELILITIAAPLIYIVLKDRRAAVLSLLLIFLAAVYYVKLPFHPVNEDALFYYMSGAALSIHLKEKENSKEAQKWLFAVGLIAFVICEGIYMGGSIKWYMYGIIGGRISGTLALFALSGIIIDELEGDGDSRKVIRLPAFTKCNFFIYAIHYLEIRFFRMAANAAFGGKVPDEAGAVLYILMPLLCIALGAAAAELMKKYVPGPYSFLTGGRG